ncbi:hypothetical protein [Chitinophaga sp.]|uniref:hypothetical protein n=1 Tax=Chitinophaga sp. TaxID=1869181 RepID=UPI0031D6C488
MKQYLRLTAIACCTSALLFPACTKTEIVAPPEEYPAQILEYKIVNVQGEPIQGAINEKDSTIAVYLPIYRQLVTLEPEIKVTAGATIQPASGTFIEGLLSIFRKKGPIKYIVTAANGRTRTYTLKIEAQQPPVTLEELSASATDVNEYTLDMKPGFSSISFTVKGTGFHENHDLLEVLLVDESGKEYPPLAVGLSTNNDLTRLNISIAKFNEPYPPIVTALPATGLYKVRVYVYGKSATMQYPIRITKLQ